MIQYASMSDAELQAKTPEFKQRYQNGETLDEMNIIICPIDSKF